MTPIKFSLRSGRRYYNLLIECDIKYVALMAPKLAVIHGKKGHINEELSDKDYEKMFSVERKRGKTIVRFKKILQKWNTSSSKELIEIKGA